MGILFIMDPSKGHVEAAYPVVEENTTLTEEQEAAVKEAQRLFTEAMAGPIPRLAYSDTGERVTTFDPALREIYILCPMAGG